MRKIISFIAAALFLITAFHMSLTSYATADNSSTLDKKYDPYWKWWDGDSAIASKKLSPDSTVKKLLDQAEKDGIIEFSPDLLNPDGEVYYKEIGKTPSFVLFLAGPGNTMVLKTPDGGYLSIDAPAVSVHGLFPDCTEYDLDEDGENELVFKLHVLHGTGYLEDASFIADTDDKNNWNVYWIDPNFYMPVIAKHVEAKVSSGKATLYVDGKKEGETPEIDLSQTGGPEYGLYLENFVQIDIYDGRLWVGSRPVFDSYSMTSPGVVVWNSFGYNGAGKFVPEDVVVRPSSYVYETITTDHTEDYINYIWENPDFEMPLLITANKSDIVGENTKYNVKVSSCDVSVLKNGKLELIGQLKGTSNKYPIAVSPDGLYLVDDHSLYIYGPDATNKKLVIRDGVEDNTISKFSSHKGYIRIRNDKAETISKAEYEALYEKYEYASPLLFN